MPLPVSPATPPVNMEQYDDNVKKWDAFLEKLTSPGIANTLLTSGLTMLQNRQPGESNTAHAAKGVAAGLSAYEQGKQQELKDTLAKTESEQRGRQVAVQEGQLGVQQGQLGETVRHNQADEQIARDRIASNDKYYAALAASTAAKSGGQLAWDDALNIARQGLDKQMEEMSAVLQMMDAKDPNYATFSGELQRVQQNYNQLLQQRAAGYMSLGSGAGGGGRGTLSPAAIAQIRGQAGYAANAAQIEAKLRAYQGDAYTPPAGAAPPTAPATSAALPTPTTTGEAPQRTTTPAPQYGAPPAGVGFQELKDWRAKRALAPVLKYVENGQSVPPEAISAARERLKSLGISVGSLPDEYKRLLGQ